MERGVVVGVDETPESWEALQWAAQEALFRDRPLRIVHVYKGHRRMGDREPEGRNDIFEAAMTFAHARLGISWVSGALVSGEPAPTLLAEAAGADLLVVGSTRDVDPVSAALTSVSAELAWRADCPVLVVRGSEPWRRVVVGIAHPEGCSGVLEFAFEEARERYQGLSVIHCFDTSTRLQIDIERATTAEVSSRARSASESCMAQVAR